MLAEEQADAFAAAWVAAWNGRDLDAILAHYADDVEFASPFVARLTGDPAGVLRGKNALRDYFASALERFPDLHFELDRVLVGARTVALAYRSVRDLHAVEVMALRNDLIHRVEAHYRPLP